MIEKKVLKFEVRDLLPIGLMVVVLGIGLTYGLSVMSDVQDDTGESVCSSSSAPTIYENHTIYDATLNDCCNSSTHSATVNCTQPLWGAEFNASEDSIIGVGKIPEKIPLIMTVVVAAVIIGVLVRYLMVRM